MKSGWGLKICTESGRVSLSGNADCRPRSDGKYRTANSKTPITVTDCSKSARVASVISTAYNQRAADLREFLKHCRSVKTVGLCLQLRRESPAPWAQKADPVELPIAAHGSGSRTLPTDYWCARRPHGEKGIGVECSEEMHLNVPPE